MRAAETNGRIIILKPNETLRPLDLIPTPPTRSPLSSRSEKKGFEMKSDGGTVVKGAMDFMMMQKTNME
jgi:hypothetical protein